MPRPADTRSHVLPLWLNENFKRWSNHNFWEHTVNMDAFRGPFSALINRV